MTRTIESFSKDEKKKEGWLTKRGNLAKTWKRRYFVLTRDSLYYFKGQSIEENMSRSGSGDFLACLSLDEYNSIEEVVIKGKDNTFCLYHTEDKGTRSLVMSASTADEKREWISAIQSLLRTDIPHFRVEPPITDQKEQNDFQSIPPSSMSVYSDDTASVSSSVVSTASTVLENSPQSRTPSTTKKLTESQTPPPSPSTSQSYGVSVFKSKVAPSPSQNKFPTFDPFTDDQKALMEMMPDNEFAKAKLVPPTSKTDAMYKVILVGDSGVGKTNLIRVFNGEPFKSNIVATVGADFISKTYSLPDDQNVKIQIWDTAGQERYHSVMKAYYRGCSGAFIVFDINQRPTYERIDYWLKELELNCNTDSLVIGIIGNKADLLEKNQNSNAGRSSASSSFGFSSVSSAVPHSEAEEMAKSKEMFFVEASALNSKNVHKAFLSLFQEIHDVANQRRKSRTFTNSFSEGVSHATIVPQSTSSEPNNEEPSSSCFC